MATITVRVDDDTKKQAEVILDDIGINLTTLFNACLKALVREQRVPFELASAEYVQRKMIRKKLEESQVVASDPTVKRYTHDEIFKPLRERLDYGIQD
jgi:DNA-damage-inducible protein J